MYSIELQTVFYKYQNKNHKIKPSFVSPGLRPLAADKTDLNLKIFHFDIRGKLSIIRCDKYILLPPLTFISQIFIMYNTILQDEKTTTLP